MSETSKTYARGVKTRTQVLGEDYVANKLENTNELTRDFQELVTETAWGKLWSNDAITRRERSMIVLAILATLGHHEELELHLRATFNTGASVEDVKQVLMHVAVYAGVPAANNAFRIAERVFDQ